MEPTKKTLDRLIPLANGSHADVVSYGIDIPMRYAECYAVLADGTVTRFRYRAQLLGWSGSAQRRSIYFKADDCAIRIRTNAGRRRQIRSIDTWPEFVAIEALSGTDPQVRELEGPLHEVVARDGKLLFVSVTRECERGAPARERRQRVPGMAVSIATGNPA